MSGAALLAEVRRGTVTEITVRGHVVAVDRTGRVLARAGDPEAVTTVRSTVKPLQAQPFVAGGAADAIGATAEEVAVACASHEGEPRHVATVRGLLRRAGVPETALACGVQVPYSAAAAWALAAAGERPGRIHNNCSGKHAGMLAACAHLGLPLEGYLDATHPLQRRVAAVFSRQAGVDVDTLPRGVDGCGLPTYAMPLRALALMFASAAVTDPGFRRCQDAMAAHPFLVGGTGRFDTALLAAAGDRLTAKSGGAAVWVAVARPEGPAVAVKLEAGIGAQMAPVALAALRALDLLPGPLGGDLERHARGVVVNWAGVEVGETAVRLDLRRP